METRNLYSSAFRALVDDAWLPAIKAGEEAAKNWLAVADDCLFFYSAACGFQFDRVYRDRAFATPDFSPKFKLTLQKGFDVVALFLPSLLAQAPGRSVMPVDRTVDLERLLTNGAELPLDPMLQQIIANAAMERQMVAQRNTVVAQLYQSLLDLSSREFPGGGLEVHARRALVDTLIQGRGCLWVEARDMPTGGKMVGSAYASPRDLVIDPHAKSVQEAQWIARRREEPVWKVARRFGLKESVFKSAKKKQNKYRGKASSGKHSAVNSFSPGDLVVYYEVFSKCGAARRVMSTKNESAFALDELVGDYAYVVVCDGVKFPLNAQPEQVMQELEAAEDDSIVVDRFSWPIPTWLDNEWPVTEFDLYEEIGQPYPVTLMQNGIGLLKLVNILLCAIANKTWGNVKDTVFTSEAYAKQIKDAVNDVASDEVLNIVGVKTPGELAEEITKAIYVYKPTSVDPGIWNLVDRILAEFNKMTGLVSLLYGGEGGSQSRSSTDAETKRDALQNRPQYYQALSERWLQRAANKEKLAARWLMEPSDLGTLFTQHEQILWEQFVVMEPVESALRELDVTIDPGSSSQPNKTQRINAVAQAMPFMTAELSKHADVTGNTGPLNRLYAMFLDTLDMTADGLEMEPRVPPMDPTMFTAGAANEDQG